MSMANPNVHFRFQFRYTCGMYLITLEPTLIYDANVKT